MWVGVLGLLLLAIGWIPQLLKVLKEKEAKIDAKFGTLYAIACLLLAIHAYMINDVIFLILNVFAGLMGVLTLYYSIKK